MENTEYEKGMARVRADIDAIDKQLLPLFLQRMACSERVAALKKDAGQPVFNAAREQQILARVSAEAGDYGSEAAGLFSAIMAISRSRQHKLLGGGEALRALERSAARVIPAIPAGIVCQGVEGAYSHQAALELFGDAPISFEPTWKQVFEDVQDGKAQFGVLPVENSAAGSVTGVYDLLLKYRFFIVGERTVKVEHCLCTATPEAPVKKVISHPQALSQCAEYIETHGLESAEFSNTAAAAAYAACQKQPGLGALCSREAAEKYGLTVLEEEVQDNKNNRTRFVVISKEPILPESANKISLCFSIPHEPGSLHSVLQRFSLRGLNMTKIESRPIPGSVFEYDFYLDFSGSIHDPDTLDLICSLHDELPRFSFLGNYNEC